MSPVQFGPLTFDVKFVSLAAGGLYKFAFSTHPSRSRRTRTGHNGPGQCSLTLEKNSKALKLIETSPEDRPLAVQLFGSVPEEMRDAAVYLESLGVASVDINMGCPVQKGMPSRRRLRDDD